MKPKVLIADKLSASAVDVFAERGVQADVKTGLKADALAKIIGDYDGLAVRSATKATPELLKRATRLKVIGRAGIGIDNINLPAASAAGVIVMNTPLGNSITTAEHAIAMMMALARQIPQADASTRAGKWEKNRFMGVELAGKTLGILGCGNVGALVAERGRGLRMKVIAADPFLSPERAQDLGVEIVDLDTLFARADILTLHAPTTPQTRGIVNKARLSRMKKGARLINCARGELVDETALKAALESGHIAGAALDVFAEEPARENALFALDNVICTPHLGASTGEAQEKVAVQVAEQMSDYLVHGSVANALNMPNISGEDAHRLAPFVALAECLGSFAGQISRGTLKRAHIVYAGDAIEGNMDALNAAILSGALAGAFAGINMVSAPVIAKERGIEVAQESRKSKGAYENYIHLRIETNKVRISFAGTVFSDRAPRIVRVNDINMESEFAPHMLYVAGRDRPGFIGALGEMLGKEGVNIASLALGRDAPEENAIALFAVDAGVAPDTLARIAALDYVLHAHALVFETAVAHAYAQSAF